MMFNKDSNAAMVASFLLNHAAKITSAPAIFLIKKILIKKLILPGTTFGDICFGGMK